LIWPLGVGVAVGVGGIEGVAVGVAGIGVIVGVERVITGAKYSRTLLFNESTAKRSALESNATYPGDLVRLAFS
jgi:hypothetical protein